MRCWRTAVTIRIRLCLVRNNPIGQLAVTLLFIAAVVLGAASQTNPSPSACNGAPSPVSVERLDHFLAGSPLAGYGQAFYDAGVANGIDPRLLVALAYAESSNGRHITRGDANNIFNWEYNGKHHSPYPSIAVAIGSLAEGLNEGYFLDLTTDYEIYRVFCKGSCHFGRIALWRALRSLECNGRSKAFPCGPPRTTSATVTNTKQAVR